VTSLEPYLPIEEVARRLDLPLGVLVRRAEAGDIPVRRVDGPDGPRFSVRLSDLGVEREPAAEDEAEPDDEIAPPPALDIVGSARPWDTEPELAAPEPEAAVAEIPEVSEREPEAPEPPLVHDAGPAIAEAIVPEIQRQPSRFPVQPRSEVAQMTLDPRELVAGLLERWERTLEQRIYAEQRQRFEAELNARQNLVKQLQLELQAVRAENAASLADRDRRIADGDRTLVQLQRDLAEAREVASRRRWFFRH